MLTTMNAPLSGEEEAHIMLAWAKLLRVGASKVDDEIWLPPMATIPEMRGHATALIEAAHELRRAIADAEWYANKRAFPDRPRPKSARVVPGPWDMAQAITKLGITEEELADFLQTRKGD